MTQKTARSLLTIAELSRNLELPESTARYYCNRFASYLPSVGDGRRRRYKPEALEKLRTIAETMRRDKNAYAVDLALRSGDAVGADGIALPASQDGSGAASHAFAAQILTLMESQTRSLQNIAGAMSIFAERLSVALPLSDGSNPSAETASLHEQVVALREQMRAAEAVHQNDLEQLRKWLTRLGEALADRK